MNLDPFKERRDRERREARELGTCGYDHAVDWMRDVQRSEVRKNIRLVRVRIFYEPRPKKPVF